MEQIDPKAIPAKACTLASGTFQIGDNGADAKSHPVTILARSSEPVEHWFWGNCIHDFSGMRLAKDRIPLDYCHDEKDIIGYANKHAQSMDGLQLSGALVPWRDSDRASEIAFKAGAGVPYEASISFAGDGIKFEFVEDGETAQANGRDYAGPCVIFREWPLRGVAICPHGADEHTAAQFAASETFAAEQINTDTGEQEMATQKHVEQAVEAPENAAEPVTELSQGVEAAQAEAVEAEETATEATEEAPVTEPQSEQQEAASIDRAEFQSLTDTFGAEIAAKTVLSGGGLADAWRFKAEALETENEKLNKQVTELSANSAGGKPAKRSESAEAGKKSIWS